ncbi:HK97 family phage prohead protease [Nocardiopsis dassonvillei]|uniref:HK97 family phage prohead protease n=1 Tax=Nocardiopsis dassonvillei TaxID=2014 RepID=UPI0036276A13
MTDRRLSYGRAVLDANTPPDEPLVFTASSTTLNRHGFSLRTDGWRLENYQANPVVLWMHDAWRPPIGRAAAALDGDRVRAAIDFDQGDPDAVKIESKFRRGFLNAVSVGLDFVDSDGAPMDTWRMSAQQITDEAFYDLAEISAVTVPADPKAVVEKQRLALAGLGRELVDLFDAQENDTTITAADLRSAVRAELDRLGIDPTAPVRPDPQPAGIDHNAAASVLAAFGTEGVLTS